MIDDIFNLPVEIEIGGDVFQLEFDNKAYAMVEKLMNKGIYKVFSTFVSDENLQFEDCIKILCAGLMKHHSKEEIEHVRKILEDDIAVVTVNYHLLKQAFAIPLSVPKSVLKKRQQGQVKKKEQEKEIEFNWVHAHMVARSVLGWSEREFWEATPRRYLAHYSEYIAFINKQSSQIPEPLVGKQAIADLQRIASRIS